MNTLFRRSWPLTMLLLTAPSALLAQALPTSQPAFLRIIREDVKPGRAAEHARHETGWPAAFEKAKSPDYYLAMESLTNNEAWYVIPAASYAAMGEMLAREREPGLGAEMDRLARADGELINGWRAIELRARPELSRGAYPDTSKQRYWEVTVFRMRPGARTTFADVAKAYGAAAGRAGVDSAYRVYEVVAGMPEPTFFVFSSVTQFADFDKSMAAGEATMRAMTDADAPLGKKFDEGLISSETYRLRLSPEMSYVPAATRAADAAFWSPKKTAPAKATSAKSTARAGGN
jgi:hypothetical protein